MSIQADSRHDNVQHSLPNTQQGPKVIYFVVCGLFDCTVRSSILIAWSGRMSAL